ncbi:uncharacterized protein Tco025E_07311 [Trypanosoma conorhini]|uniref:Uncharacterized protein n=1 Tax=Trypanosoma conorhini TaxID=83891 RepID=A0A422NQG3_9TRYP|nr:uncharacterized protein Tco025E_07311 [Trypanosoma conorhini]RNF07718.1 hypothetical protein Tco025E_07311 [Trypanosoma conorhini]
MRRQQESSKLTPRRRHAVSGVSAQAEVKRREVQSLLPPPPPLKEEETNSQTNPRRIAVMPKTATPSLLLPSIAWRHPHRTEDAVQQKPSGARRGKYYPVVPVLPRHAPTPASTADDEGVLTHCSAYRDVRRVKERSRKRQKRKGLTSHAQYTAGYISSAPRE